VLIVIKMLKTRNGRLIYLIMVVANIVLMSILKGEYNE